jgi:hypothetical protein
MPCKSSIQISACQSALPAVSSQLQSSNLMHSLWTLIGIEIFGTKKKAIFPASVWSVKVKSPSHRRDLKLCNSSLWFNHVILAKEMR